MIRYSKGCLKDYRDYTVFNTKEKSYSDLIVCYDIEVSSAWVKNGVMYAYKHTRPNEFYEDKTPVSLCYIWQCGINEDIYYGREIEEYLIFLEELISKTRGIITIWVHNLSYEFVELLNIIQFKKIFARSPHKVIYCEWRRIMFRCSYFLTRLSLENWGKDLNIDGVKKKVGQLNYNKIRTPLTNLKDYELEYAEYDIVVMYHGIKRELEKYEHIYKIPLTQTGKVRRKVKQIYKRDIKWHKTCTNLLPRDSAEYARLKLVFAGGYTHANYMYADQVIENVKGKDRSSSYPAVMCTKKYPMSKWQKVDDYSKYLGNDNYSLIIDIEFVGLRCKTFNTYIQRSKCYEIEGDKFETIIDNGRISRAKKISTLLTNVDYDIVIKCYDWDEINIKNAWMSINDYLPKKLVEYILQLYHDKTSLKGIFEKLAIYRTSKEEINSIFGMMVTAIIQEDILFNGNGDWKVVELSPEMINEKLNDLREKPIKNFTAYQHGVFITAYARRELWKVILKIDADNVYSDTDASKYIGNHDDVFEKINSELISEIKKVCAERGLNENSFTAIDPKGNAHTLGLWEDDGEYSEFVTLGAKRYAYRDAKDGKLHITVSGVSKKKGVTALRNDIKKFNRDLVFRQQDCGKLLFTYLSDMQPTIWNKGKYDEYVSSHKYGINARSITYTMSLSDSYSTLIEIADEIKTNMDYDATELYKIMERKKSEQTKILQDNKHTKKRR